MTASQHALYEELAAAYALSALEPDEAQLFELHLAGCARCELELAEHTALADQFAYAVLDAAPPASILAGIRAGIAASDRVVTSPAATDAAPVTLGAVTPSTPTPSNVLPLRRRRPEHLRGWLVAAAALVLVVSLGVSNLVLRSDRDSAQEASVRLGSAVTQVVNSRTVQLRAADGKVMAVALVSNQHVSLVLDGMPRNDSQSSIYVLWRKPAYGSAVAVGVFDVHDSKVDVARTFSLQGVDGVTTLAITLEHGRVAPASAGAPLIAVGQLT